MFRSTLWLFLVCAQIGAFAQSNETITERNVQNQIQPISATHGVEKGFFASASFLYWKGEIDQLDYSVTSQIETHGSQSQSDGKIHELDFEWSPAGQLEIGYLFDQREGWKASLRGTHFCTNAHGSSHVPNTNFRAEQMSPTWFPPFSGEFATKASAHWHLNFNTIDLTLGRDFFISKWLSFFPYLGLQGAWIDQHYKTNYDAFYVSQAGILFRRNDLHFRHHFKGVGIEFGGEFLFHMIDSLSILGNVEGSLLWGVSNTHQKVNGAFPIQNEGLFEEKISLHNAKHRVRSSIYSELGLIWEKMWHRNQRRFYLSATYAFSIWFNQAEFRNLFLSSNVLTDQATAYNFPIFERNQADLQLQGLVLRAGFDL